MPANPSPCSAPTDPHLDGPEHCTVGTHDHWMTRREWLNGNDAASWPGGEINTIPRTCADCGRPAFYDTEADRYRHVDPAASCFLIPAR